MHVSHESSNNDLTCSLLTYITYSENQRWAGETLDQNLFLGVYFYKNQ